MSQATNFTIARLDAIPLQVPFGDLVSGPRASPQSWRTFDMVLVRAETTDGVVGWGECFAYSCLRPVLAAVRDMVFPLVAGREIVDIPALNAELQFKLHIFGRYGIGMFAISGLDIALWDIAAKRSGRSLADFIGGPKRDVVPAYASLVRYGEAALVAQVAGHAVQGRLWPRQAARDRARSDCRWPPCCRRRRATDDRRQLQLERGGG